VEKKKKKRKKTNREKSTRKEKDLAFFLSHLSHTERRGVLKKEGEKKILCRYLLTLLIENALNVLSSFFLPLPPK